MRLIDADALVAQEEFFAKTFKGDFGEQVANHVIEVINYAPTVDAVPVSFIQKRMDELKDIADYEFIVNGGYVGNLSYQVHELEQLLKAWAERKEE